MIHKTAYVEDEYQIGQWTNIWYHTIILGNTSIGEHCTIGSNVFIEENVTIGNKCKIQNFACIYDGVKIGDGVFIGPHVCFTNDKYPRALNDKGTKKTKKDWALLETIVEDGVSIGANSTILCGIKIGRNSVIGAGSVVTKDVPPNTEVKGNPAKIKYEERKHKCGTHMKNG